MRPIASTACLACAAIGLLSAGCSGSHGRTGGDAGNDPDVQEETDVPSDTEGEDEGDSTEWADCPGRESVSAWVSGPCSDAHDANIIEANGEIASITRDDPTAIGIDFSASAPEIGTVTFEVPLLPGELEDLSVGDSVYVDYDCWFFWGFWGKLMVSRDGILLLAWVNGGGFGPMEMGGMQLTPVEGGCEPYDHCGPGWSRYYYEVSCDGLAEPAVVWDGSEAVVACGPGYRIAVADLVSFAGDPPMMCTDYPPARDLHMIVRQ